MKALMYSILVLVLITVVSAVPTGTNYTIHSFDECSSLSVTVTGSQNIDDDEYFLHDCNEVFNNTWDCNCSDGFDLILSTKINTINSYTFSMDYNYEKETSSLLSSSSSGGSSVGNIGEIIFTDDDEEETETEEMDTESEAVEEFEAPMVGTFYRAPAPDAEPFVEIGDKVQKGDTLCIIEAMKLMNEIEVETSGIIKDILVKDSESVEYGQTLFRIKQD